MPKPNKQQIRDAIDDARGANPHLGLEYCIYTVMDQYDISGLDIALAYIEESEDKDEAEIRTGDDGPRSTAAVVETAQTEDDKRVALEAKMAHDKADADRAEQDAADLRKQAGISQEAADKANFEESQRREDEEQAKKRLDPDNASETIDPDIEAKKRDFDDESEKKKAALNKEHPLAGDATFAEMTKSNVSSKVADNTSKGEATKMAVPGEVKNMPNQGFAANNPNRDGGGNVQDTKAKVDVTQSAQNRNVDKKAVPGETASKSNQGFAKNNPNRK